MPLFGSKNSVPKKAPKGEAAEQLAEQWLAKQGLALVARNYRCRFGEIDRIMRDGSTLVFLEVRHRQHASFSSGAESITASKQRKLIQTAQHYLASSPTLAHAPCRFDVVSIDGAIHADHITWLKDAFQAY